MIWNIKLMILSFVWLLILKLNHTVPQTHCSGFGFKDYVKTLESLLKYLNCPNFIIFASSLSQTLWSEEIKSYDAHGSL